MSSDAARKNYIAHDATRPVKRQEAAREVNTGVVAENQQTGANSMSEYARFQHGKPRFDQVLLLLISHWGL